MGHKSVYFSLKFHNSIFQNNHKIRRKSHRIGRPTVTIITWYFHRYYYKWFLQVSLRIIQQLLGMGQVYQVNTHDWVQKVCKIFAMMEAIWRDTGEQFDTLICTPELPPVPVLGWSAAKHVPLSEPMDVGNVYCSCSCSRNKLSKHHFDEFLL